jgi:hypothetical protein
MADVQAVLADTFRLQKSCGVTDGFSSAEEHLGFELDGDTGHLIASTDGP